MTTILAPLDRLRLDLSEMTLGADPDLLKRELIALIQNAIAKHPRSLQRSIGPSEIGHTCVRRLAFMLADVAPVTVRTSWLPTVGTAVHAWLAEQFVQIHLVPKELAEPTDMFTDERPRFLTEFRVDVGEIDGQQIVGSADLYDRVTATGIEWKVVGVTTLRRVRAEGASTQYRVQAHLYGRGFRRRGLPVERVACMFLPRNGELSDAVMWSEHYDESIATEALTRADAIAYAMRIASPDAIIPQLAATEDMCGHCPWFRPGIAATATHCPGPDDRPDPNAARLAGITR